jgi:hypothetical protein
MVAGQQVIGVEKGAHPAEHRGAIVFRSNHRL